MNVFQYRQLLDRVDGLKLRERVLILIAGVTIVFFVTDTFAFQPMYEKQHGLLQDIQDQQVQLALLQNQSMELSEGQLSDEPSPLEQLNQELSRFGEQMNSRLDSMLSPEMAASILEQIIIEEKGLTLNSVTAGQAPLMSIVEDDVDGQERGDIYRYELELELEGGYLDTLGYLRALEALPWKFFFERISFSTTNHPSATVDLEIYTLGSAGN